MYALNLGMRPGAAVVLCGNIKRSLRRTVICLSIKQLVNKLVRQSQKVQSAIDSSGTVVPKVFTHARFTSGLCLPW